MSIVLLFVKCINNQDSSSQDSSAKQIQSKSFEPVTYQQFAGSETCLKCHQSITTNYFQTAHYLTSQPASKQSIKGSFKTGQNSFIYDVGKIVKLEKQEDSFYQVYYYKGKKIVQRRFDIVVGSGNRGQTYLSWIGNHIIELPVSYFTQVHQWANSPGYPLSPIIFNRPVTARCLECHGTYATTINYNPDVPPMFDSSQMMLTVGCEKCHGPAAKHVAYEQAHPNDTIGMFIINPDHLTKQLQLDVCALCHNGKLQEKQPPFQFVAGDSLNDFYNASDEVKKAGVMDVHGNQFGVLAASKCFQMSKTMTCITCHDPHKNETGNTLLFSQRCISCHSNQHKQIANLPNDVVKNNCIDCHMPLQESTSISFLLQNKTQPVNAVMRTHYITIYNDETKKFIERYSKSKK
ncbi:MAG: multiheme c-type cytochrome [Parafilimonas sp.]